MFVIARNWPIVTILGLCTFWSLNASSEERLRPLSHVQVDSSIASAGRAVGEAVAEAADSESRTIDARLDTL